MNRIFTIMAVTAALFATAGNVVRAQEQPANNDLTTTISARINSRRTPTVISRASLLPQTMVAIMCLITLIKLKSI